jgi:excisionase family DNA binding protein
LPVDTGFQRTIKNTQVQQIDEKLLDKLATAVADKINRQPNQVASKLISITEAGHILGMGRSTIYRLMDLGKLPKHRIGSRALISRSDVEQLLDA